MGGLDEWVGEQIPVSPSRRRPPAPRASAAPAADSRPAPGAVRPATPKYAHRGGSVKLRRRKAGRLLARWAPAGRAAWRGAQQVDPITTTPDPANLQAPWPGLVRPYHAPPPRPQAPTAPFRTTRAASLLHGGRSPPLPPTWVARQRAEQTRRCMARCITAIVYGGENQQRAGRGPRGSKRHSVGHHLPARGAPGAMSNSCWGNGVRWRKGGTRTQSPNACALGGRSDGRRKGGEGKER